MYKQRIVDSLSDVRDLWVTDRQLAIALKARHLRKGKLTKEDTKEGAGIEVIAFGHDELNNITAICQDGHIRQFIN